VPVVEEIKVYVPEPGSPLARTLPARSALVGVARGDRVEICYERPTQAVNVVTWGDRVHHAWEAQTHGFVSSRRLWARVDEVVAVGSFRADVGEVALDGSGAARLVAAWLGSDELDEAELIASGSDRYETLRALRRAAADPRQRPLVPYMARACGVDPATL
jgi:hypothetical protein